MPKSAGQCTGVVGGAERALSASRSEPMAALPVRVIALGAAVDADEESEDESEDEEEEDEAAGL